MPGSFQPGEYSNLLGKDNAYILPLVNHFPPFINAGQNMAFVCWAYVQAYPEVSFNVRFYWFNRGFE